MIRQYLYRWLIWCGVLFTYGCAHRASLPVAGDRAFSEQALAGEQIFMTNCQRCHPQGEAGLGPAVYVAPNFMKRYQVRHGLGAMPAFDKQHISDKELDQLITYLDERKK